ncbi:hypothetical protein AEQ67_11195 [Pseudomonas sp. RIT-PI-q]|nr:hypothetical protein AEQ67_11195 [Pseudomonas sp. RIT-PI-q]
MVTQANFHWMLRTWSGVVARHKKTAIQTVFFKKRYLVSSTGQPSTWFKFFATGRSDLKKAELIG